MKEKLLHRVGEAHDGNHESTNKIIEYFYPKIQKKANFINKDMAGDLVGAGCLRLYDAIKKFDPEKSDNFPVYAWIYIYRGMYEYMGKYRSPISLPSSIYSDIASMEKAASKYLETYGTYPNGEELMSMMGWGAIKYNYVFNMLNGKYAYFDSLVDYDLQISTLVYEQQSLAEIVSNEMIVDEINKYVGYLSEKEQKIYDMKVNKHMNLETIGKEVGLTRERVRQIYKKILSKIRIGLGNMKLGPQI